MSRSFPLARSEALITEELDGELLVYDSESNMAHALDADAAAVWRACDGRTDTSILAARCGTSEEKVRDALARLGELGLLEDDRDGETRRVALRKIGIAGVGAATINSILVPAAAAASSCVSDLETCVPGPASCCTGRSTPGGCFGVGGPQQGIRCCLPAGACAVMIRQGIGGCCNGSVPDPTCPGGVAGQRCT
jgi:hypothetical protein